MKYIELTQNQKAIVDDDEFDILSQFKWCAHFMKSNKTFYATSWINGEPKSMHRFLLNAKKGQVVDHLNHNTLDNRIENIVICTQQQNQRNQKIRNNSASGFTGVTWNKREYRWYSLIVVNYKVIYLGSFVELEDAIDARKKANIKYGFNPNHGSKFIEKQIMLRGFNG